MDDDQEWKLQTWYARTNRLKSIAIYNKHAAIKGTPHIEEDDAKRVVGALLTMKGAAKKKHKDAQASGQVKLHSKPLPYRGSAAEWKHATDKDVDWASHPAPHIKPQEEEEVLKALTCPE